MPRTCYQAAARGGHPDWAGSRSTFSICYQGLGLGSGPEPATRLQRVEEILTEMVRAAPSASATRV